MDAKKKNVLMLEMLFLTVFFANLNPCVMMLFADSSARQAENRENYHGAFFLKKVSGAVMSFMLLRPCLEKDSRAASSSNLLEM